MIGGDGKRFSFVDLETGELLSRNFYDGYYDHFIQGNYEFVV